MKTIKFLAFAFIGAMAFTSCSQEDDVVTKNDPNIVRFDASIEGRNLKVSLEDSGEGGSP
ncbi:MAG: hypothetical protein ACK5M3_19015 [Dysgonomonas sp.]